MQRWRLIILGLALFISGVEGGLAQDSVNPTTLKGILVSIKGDVYMMQDLSGRFVQFRMDQKTQRERLVVPGERVEVQLSPDHRAIAIKPAQ